MKKLMFVLVAVTMAMPVLAQKAAKTSNPNRVICRSEEVLGSRLQKTRRCMTAQQWTQLAREQRETTERVQTSKFSQGN